MAAAAWPPDSPLEWRARLRSVAREEPPGLPEPAGARCPSSRASTWVQASLDGTEATPASSLAELAELSPPPPVRPPTRPEPPEAPPPTDDAGPAGSARRAAIAAPWLPAPVPTRCAAPGRCARPEVAGGQPPGAGEAAEALLGARLEESLAQALDASLGPALARALASAPLLDALRLAAAAAGCEALQVRSVIRFFLAEQIPAWSNFLIADVGVYLGAHIGPGATNELQWLKAIPKWWDRLFALSTSGAPTDALARLYQTSSITVLSYLAQFFWLPKVALTREIHALHRVLRMPPSTFRLQDILAMSTWMTSPSPTSLKLYNVATMWRMANYTIVGWTHFLGLLDAMAVQYCPLPAFARGRWSPPFWKEPMAIVQRYAALNSGQSPLLPTTHVQLDTVRDLNDLSTKICLETGLMLRPADSMHPCLQRPILPDGLDLNTFDTAFDAVADGVDNDFM
ncbi:unnamed protein product [Prorocentrum cordatum]|uniref:Uncharacterized protein n=1 Tax=Prorocentrum cordatum TaxID=2364126 RepID=A0ABN9WUS8_9DINO|nr:unnamed protein product [Polarella glacialis]